MKRLIAQVSIPLSISLDRCFDYEIPKNFSPKVKVGCRVIVPLGSRRICGYVVKVKPVSAYKSPLKEILLNLDETPLINEESFELARFLRETYFCPLADALAAILPQRIKFKTIDRQAPNDPILLTQEEEKLLQDPAFKKKTVLIADESGQERWGRYRALIKKTLASGKSVLLLIPHLAGIPGAIKTLSIEYPTVLWSSNQKTAQQAACWSSLSGDAPSFIIGTRSAVLLPLRHLGLIIMDDEDHFAYEQEQTPKYKTHEIALWHARRQNAQLIFGALVPSLNTYRLVTRSKDSECITLRPPDSDKKFRIIDLKGLATPRGGEKGISKTLELLISENLNHQNKMVFFLQKKGFSSMLYCRHCKKIQACSRCSAFLSYHYQSKSVSCPICHWRGESFDICPACKSSYIKYLGYGTEKIESELLRLFPSARIRTYPSKDFLTKDYDIMLSTQQMLEDPRFLDFRCDCVAVLSCEQMLSHVDYRSTEKAFSKFYRLTHMAEREIWLQTKINETPVLEYLQKADVKGFLENELKERAELNLPPSRSLSALIVRARHEEKAKEAAKAHYKALKKIEKIFTDIQVFEPVACSPFKVRGNYRFQVLLKYAHIDPLKNQIKKIVFTRSRDALTFFQSHS